MRIVIAFLLCNLISLAAHSQALGSKQGQSLLGDALYAPKELHPVVEQKLKEATETYTINPDDPDALVWYGRRMGYTGDYLKTIEIFKEGMQKHPQDARFHRHAGHRYISIRKLDEAITALTKASKLIEGTQNSIEPDGIPNAKGIPVSSLHGNIWYHLGLAYYLKQDFENALWAYTNARDASNNADNIVSTTHWLYMILRRLGREAEAKEVLSVINEDMPVIENFAYFQLCLFYKGAWSLEKLLKENNGGPQGAGMAYGIANWHFYNNMQEEAEILLSEIIADKPQWPSFGYIAAEADLAARR